MSVYDTRNRKSNFAAPNLRMHFVLAAVLAICFQLLPLSAHAGQYVAFYYDAQGRLLQVEDVPDEQIQSQNRILVDLHDSLLVVPMLTNKSVPLVSGLNLPMSKFAVLAVYYEDPVGNRAANESNVQAQPAKVEYLGTVQERVLSKCLGRSGDQICRLPRRCHCILGSCCCY